MRIQQAHRCTGVVSASAVVTVRPNQPTVQSQDHAATGYVLCRQDQQWQQSNVYQQQSLLSKSFNPVRSQHHSELLYRKRAPDSKHQRQCHAQHAQHKLQHVDVKAAVRQCSSWEQLASYLTSEQQLRQPSTAHGAEKKKKQKQKQSQRIASKQCQLWSQLDGHQAKLVLQHATQLASVEGRRPQQQQVEPQQDAATAASCLSAPGDFAQQAQLLHILSQLLNIAADSVAHGDAVAAAQVLRAAWKLQLTDGHSGQQHQMLDRMCGGHAQELDATIATANAVKPDSTKDTVSDIRNCGVDRSSHAVSSAHSSMLSATADTSGAVGTRAAPAAIRNANLLADVAAAVVQLELQPSSEWMQWYQRISMELLQPEAAADQSSTRRQQQQKGSSAPNAWFLVNALQLAQYCNVDLLQQAQQLQQQEALDFCKASWLQAWTTAAVNTVYPFTPSQLLIVMTAAERLKMQMPGSFIGKHLALESLGGLNEQQLLRLLPILAHMQQQAEQRFQLPETWLCMAAESLVDAAAVVAAQQRLPARNAAGQSIARLLPAAVRAAAQLRLPLAAPHVAQLLEGLLAQRQHDSRSLPSAQIATDSSSGCGSSKQTSASALRQVIPSEACAAVIALVQLSKQHPPDQHLKHLMSQLQQQLRPLLPKADTDILISLLWGVVIDWRVSVGRPFMSMFLGVTQRRLPRLSANELRMLGIVLATGTARQPLEIPAAWKSKFLKCTTAVLLQAQQQMSSKQQRPALHGLTTAAATAQHAAFISNIACCLARLQMVPDLQWQALWRQQVTANLSIMSPDQLVDVLYAAAVWSVQSTTAHASSAAAASVATATRKILDVQEQLHSSPSNGQAVSTSSKQSVLQSVSTVGVQSSQQVLHRPVFAPPPPSAPAPAQPTGVVISSSPPAVWVNAVLLQLLRCMQHCKAKQLTTVLWCLRKLEFRAAIPWLDALYDSLLAQVSACSLLQLQQLLRGLLHQNLQLAPARIDLVLQAALPRVVPGLGASNTAGCTEQQLVWLLQLVVRLKHDPEPAWSRAVARAAQQMLRQISRRRWTAVLLTELIENLAQLGPQLPPKWLLSYRQAVWNVGVRRFTGLQLARVLSALATLHCSTVAKPFTQHVLRRLAQQLGHMDPHALGLAGVAAGQLGLMPVRSWIEQYLQRVQQLVRGRVRVPVSDAGNLQRSVQYFRWCYAQRPASGAKRTSRRGWRLSLPAKCLHRRRVLKWSKGRRCLQLGGVVTRLLHSYDLKGDGYRRMSRLLQRARVPG